MKKTCLYLFNLIYFSWLFVTAIPYFFFMIFFCLMFILTRKGDISAALRLTNQWYGNYLVCVSRPFFIKTDTSDFKKYKFSGPYVIVYNHRSYTDIIFGSMIPVPNLVVFLRSWPFRIPFWGFFMRKAGYIDLEKNSIEQFAEEKGKSYASQSFSFLFFPEGHRSRDGRMQSLKSGAFYLSSGLNIPVVVISMEGTEKVAPVGSFLIHPGFVQYKVLGIITPDQFPVELRALKMKKYVEKLYQNYFNKQH